MKKISIIAATLLSGATLYASGDIESQYVTPTDTNIQTVKDMSFADSTANGTVSGSLQAQYRYFDTNNQNKLLTTSGNLKYLTNSEELLQAGFNFYGITGFRAYDNQDRIPMFLNNNGSGFAILNEAFLRSNYDFGSGNAYAKGGRFHVNEKLINSQKGSMYDYPVPNAFEGAQVGVNFTNGLSLEGIWVSRMSGQDNTINPSEFKSVENIATNLNPTINDSSNGLFFGKITYNYEDTVKVNLQDAYVDNFTNTFLEEIQVKVSSFVNIGMPVFIGQQYLNYSSEDDSTDSDVWGIETGVKFTNNILGFAAYNNIGDTAIPSFAYGADPLYTSMQNANAYEDSNVDAFKVGGKYLFTGGNVELAYGNFNGDNNDIDAYELVAEYDVTKDINVKGVVSYTDDGTDDVTGFRILAGYTF